MSVSHDSESDVDAGAPVGDRAVAGVLWLTAQKWAIRIAGVVTLAILTRFLSPEEFGLVAAAATLLPFFYLLSDLGFATYIVQAERADPRTLSTAFWFSLTAGVALAGLLFVAAPLFAVMFGSPSVAPVIRALSIVVVLTALSSVPMALLRRRMQFRALAGQGVAASLVGQAVAVGAALGGLGVWALVLQTISAQLVMTALACVAARWWPAFLFSLREFRTMAAFGGKVLGVEVVAMVRATGEAAIVSNVLGLTAYGYLSIAQKLVQIVQDLAGAALLPVTTVAFAKIRDSSERLTAAYVKALRATYALMSPPLVVLAVGASAIVPLVFGQGWEASVPVVQFLALAGTVVVGATLDHGLFYGLGKPGRWFLYAILVDALTIGVTAVAVSAGLVAVAVGFLMVAVVATAARWFIVARVLGASPLTLIGSFAFLATSVLLSGGAGWAAMSLSASLPPIAQVALAACAVLAVHAGVAWLMARAVFADLRTYLHRFGLRRRVSAIAEQRSHHG
ncbi:MULTISPECIES: lipopolysaccharide biosynthesis protein [unclassified Microbacterium]|uniref:lipopolysaccharide biosynthesis protein n=1 Tax=unclassified Microbacterium TaxID=2609290 RepID=UPI00214BCD56|nr:MULTISPECIES: lipopolysaccharide biosynthesis protein [unclassified Microbacterium]MCR2784995.1 lipopolysaccharide biosynthesis protein [Microbacterium sp. zg.B96]WIM16534.1 lipopolysaccharide biosynthesis protein [Microbacterium sp. zg-B96]